MRWNTAPSSLHRLHSLSYVAALCSASENVLLAIFCYRSDAAVWLSIAAVLLPVAGLNDNSLDCVAAYNVCSRSAEITWPGQEETAWRN